MNTIDKLKQKSWKFIYSFFHPLQTFLLKHKIIHHKGRQKYHIGWLNPKYSLEDLKLHLNTNWGFGNHFVAWVDDGQVLSWRKLTDFNNQYHLRVFKDGEIRGHFEYTPEGHPLEHFIEKGEQNKRKDFLKFLGDYVIFKKPKIYLEIDPDSFNPNSEITI